MESPVHGGAGVGNVHHARGQGWVSQISGTCRPRPARTPRQRAAQWNDPMEPGREPDGTRRQSEAPRSGRAVSSGTFRRYRQSMADDSTDFGNDAAGDWRDRSGATRLGTLAADWRRVGLARRQHQVVPVRRPRSGRRASRSRSRVGVCILPEPWGAGRIPAARPLSDDVPGQYRHPVGVAA